jgi:hypothetical protein
MGGLPLKYLIVPLCLCAVFGVLSIAAYQPAVTTTRAAARAATATRSRTKTRTKTPTRSRTRTKTRTPTRRTSQTVTPSRTRSATRVPPTATVSATATPTATNMNTATASATESATRTPTDTVTASLTASATNTATASATPTATPTATATQTALPTNTATKTATPTATVNPDKTANTIRNGGFETTGDWIDEVGGTRTMGSGSIAPERGSWMYVSSGQYGTLTQAVTVPITATYFNLSYRYTNANESCGSLMEFVWVYNEADTIGDYFEICSEQSSTQWRTLQVPMHGLAGQQQTIIIEISTQSGATLAIDNIGFVSAPARVVDYY